MCEINIKTWNVNWFRGRKSGRHYESDDQNEDCYDNIIANIENFLNKNNNSVAILQEVPFKTFGNWSENNKYYTELIKKFSEKDYEIILNVPNKPEVLRCTIAIYKKNDYEKVETYTPLNNRTVGLSYGSFTIIGVHMPTGFEKDSDDEDMWKALLKYVKEKKNELIIIGDFNAFSGCKNKLTREKYEQLSRDMKDIIPNDTPTFGTTVIDHLFVTNDIYESYNIKIEMQSEFKWSDHKYIEIKITPKTDK